MPIARREAEVLWEGPLARGTRTLKSGSGVLDQLVGRAGDLCPVSNALGGNVEISVRHELEAA